MERLNYQHLLYFWTVAKLAGLRETAPRTAHHQRSAGGIRAGDWGKAIS